MTNYKNYENCKKESSKQHHLSIHEHTSKIFHKAIAVTAGKYTMILERNLPKISPNLSYIFREGITNTCVNETKIHTSKMIEYLEIIYWKKCCNVFFYHCTDSV